MPDRLEPRLDVKIAGAINPADWGVGVLNLSDGNVSRRR
jgi:hypothetical protein